MTFAHHLPQRVRSLSPPKPVVIVVARWEYEAWFLASLETIAGCAISELPGLPDNLRYEGDVEAIRDAKGWIDHRFPAGRKYSETRDQVAMTHYLDLARVRERSRSFRRLEHAVEEISDAYLQGEVILTPLPDDEE